MNVYPFIEAEKRCRRNVKRACELLKVSRAAFYAHLAGPSRRDRDDVDLASEIESVHEESKGRYGAPRVHAELHRRGRRHGRKRVARLMRQGGLAGRAARRWKKTTIADPAAAARADRICRGLHRGRQPTGLALVRGHHLHPHLGGMAVPVTVIEYGTRRVRVLGATENPVESWVVQQARNLLMDLEDVGKTSAV